MIYSISEEVVVRTGMQMHRIACVILSFNLPVRNETTKRINFFRELQYFIYSFAFPSGFSSFFLFLVQYCCHKFVLRPWPERKSCALKMEKRVKNP